MTPPPWLAPLEAALAAAPHDPTLRYAQLATLRPDGRPANRTIVVRALTPAGRLTITADARSSKLDHLRAHPQAELCWSLPHTREQFRLLGSVAIHPHDDPESLQAWSTLSPAVRQTFTWPHPGQPLAPPESFASPAPTNPPPTFTLLILHPTYVDHLDLRPNPHSRRIHHLQADDWTTTPVNP